jgi:DNA-directed RNA polymerase subunit M/transcription elongation factor TFIIS
VSSSAQQRADWSTAPMVLVQRPACPYCLHERYEKSRTRTTDAGDTVKFCRCASCGKIYKIRLDSPDLGLDVLWP